MNTETGTVLNIEMDSLKRIETPIIISRVGSHIKSGDQSKFLNFLDYLVSSSKVFLTVRNDGSKQELYKYFRYQIKEEPDGGFFIKPGEWKSEITKPLVGVNVVSDTVQGLSYSYSLYLQEMSNTLMSFMEFKPEYNIVFFPHIYSDLKAIFGVIQRLKDSLHRQRVFVAPFLTGQGKGYSIFDLYRRCDLVVGHRFHTNVCAIGLETPSIGLVSNEGRVYNMYKSINLDTQVFSIFVSNWHKFLPIKMNKTLQDSDYIKSQYRDVKRELNEKSKSIFKEMKQWVKKKDL